VGDISVDNGVLTFVGIENGFAFKDMVPQSLDPEPPKRITTNLPFIVVEELP